MMPADLIVSGGSIITMDAALPHAQAFAVRDARIVAIGSDGEIAAHAGPATRRIELAGRTVVPGLIDSHAHLDREGLRRWYPSLAGCRSIADVGAVIAAATRACALGDWIVTAPLGIPPYHLNPATTLAEGRFPDRHDLDAVAPRHPVWIRAIWGHWGDGPPYVHVLNSAALAACAIDAHTPAPSSSVEIERDASGDLTGRILEHRITPVIEHTLLRTAPRFTVEIREAALERAMALALAGGITSIYEGHGISPDLFAAYQRLHARGAQHVRMTMPLSLPPWSSIADARAIVTECAGIAAMPGTGDDVLRISGIFLDYGGDAENAAIVAHDFPYTGWAGFLYRAVPAAEYRELCRVAARLRIRVNTIIGTALDDVLTIWEDVHAQTPIDALRWTLIHARETLPERDFPRIRRLGAVITTQPTSYAHRAGAPGVDERRLKAHRDYIDAGVPWALSTDNKPYDLRATLWSAVTRTESVHGRVVGQEQSISVMEALHALTAAGAYVCQSEHATGTLTVGKYADAVAFGKDPFTVEPEALRTLPVDLTLANGRVLHNLIDSGAPPA
jgi:predicted amidohydrolase YtcJ